MSKTATQVKNRIFVKLLHDDSVESPVDNDVFKIVTFGMNSIYDGPFPEDEIKPEDIGKTWWPLSCYRHGGAVWSIRGKETYVDAWDTSLNAGVLYLPSGDPSEVGPTPEKAAASFIETFNDWCAGNCWGYDIEYEAKEVLTGTCPCCKTPAVTWTKTDKHFGDSCYGYIGDKYFAEEVRHAFQQVAESCELTPETHRVIVTGEGPVDEVSEFISRLGYAVTTR